MKNYALLSAGIFNKIDFTANGLEIDQAPA